MVENEKDVHQTKIKLIQPNSFDKNTNQRSDLKLKERLKQKFIELSGSSTAHGYPNIFRTKYWSVRLMWLMFFLTSSGFCGFMIYRSLNDYLSFTVVTEVRRYPQIPAIFPVVTFCNLNPLITEDSENLVKAYLDKSFNISNIRTSGNASNSNVTAYYGMAMETFEILTLAKSKALNKAMDPSFGDENRKRLWFPLNETLIYCLYNGKRCDESDFVWYYMYEYGNCYQFNTGKLSNGSIVPLKQVFTAGNQNGLHLELYAGEAETDYSLQYDSGIIIFVHNQTKNPNPSEGIKIKPSFMSNIVLSNRFEVKQEYPYSDCYQLDDMQFNRALYNRIIETNVDYTQKQCFNLCLQQMIIEKCGCYYLKYLKLSDARPCLNDSELICLNEKYFSFINSDMNQQCSNYCPLECECQIYSSTISTSNFPTKKYADVLLSNDVIYDHYLGKEEILTDLIAFDMYFNELEYTLSSESPQASVYDVVANIGGTLGLFIGISLLSVVELVEIFMEMLIIYLDSKAIKKISNSK